MDIQRPLRTILQILGQIFDVGYISPTNTTAPKRLTVAVNKNIFIYKQLKHLFGSEILVAKI